MTPDVLDDSVFAASKELEGRGAPPPDVLFLLGTGVGLLPSSYAVSWRLPLERVAGIPSSWRGRNLLVAQAAGATFWFIEDSVDEARERAGGQREPWARAFPVWLAACSGATLCVHTSAGSALPVAEGPSAARKLALLSDHINLSGQTPLLGLGESRLGPLFPDQTSLHHRGVRSAALLHGERQGLPVLEAVAACTAGPVLETRAEREFYARAGAQVAVQDLASPLVAMAHAGLSCLAIVAVLDDSEEVDIPGMLAGADRLAPALDDLLAALSQDLAMAAHGLREQP